MRIGFSTGPAFAALFGQILATLLRRRADGGATLSGLAPAWRPRLTRDPGGGVTLSE